VKKNYGTIYSLPLSVWLAFFFIGPTLIIFLYSFLKKSPFGGVERSFSLDAFAFLFNPTVLQIAWMTLYISIAVAVITLFLALPTAYFMAKSRYKDSLLLFIIIPFWVNFLIRIYAWIAILGNNGFINNFLIQTGLVSDNFQFLYNPYAVVLITVYTYLPYAILPLYSTIEKFDFGLLEASKDLGATHFQGLKKIFIPGIKSGIYTAFLFTFIPALGSYAVPQLVGGTSSMMLGNVIAREIIITRNFPLASAISLILSLLTIIGILVFMKKNENEKKAVK